VPSLSVFVFKSEQATRSVISVLFSDDVLEYKYVGLLISSTVQTLHICGFAAIGRGCLLT